MTITSRVHRARASAHKRALKFQDQPQRLSFSVAWLASQNLELLIMKKLTPAMLAVLAFLPVLALAAPPRPTVIDSAGIRPGVTATLVIPQPLTTETLITTIKDQAAQASNTSAAIPAGYREIVRTMGPRQIAESELTYYGALTYGSSVFGIQSWQTPTAALACNGNLAPRLVGLQQSVVTENSNTTQTIWFVCEPLGTRSTLEKVIGAQVATLGSNFFNQFMLPGTAGVSTSAATSVCQAAGYTNFVTGSIQFQQFGNGCRADQLITVRQSNAWASTTICYNQRMNSLQCWK